MELMLEQQKQLLQGKEKAYHDLEEEFRLALRIEASRYHELQAAHQVRVLPCSLMVVFCNSAKLVFEIFTIIVLYYWVVREVQSI